MADRIHVGTRKGYFTVERTTSGKWEIGEPAFLGVQVTMVLPRPGELGGDVLAAVGHGHFGAKMHRSEDGGKTWHEITAPKFPPKPEGVADTLCPMRKIVIPWNVELIWALEAGGADMPGELWLGTIPGGLFRSTDHGASWSLVESLWNQPDRAKWVGGGYDYPGIHSIFVDPRDPKHVTVAVSCGGVWITEDRGATWRQGAHGMRNSYSPPDQMYIADGADAHRLVGCPAAPDAMWVQHHNGIFRTVDGSQSWTEHPPQPRGASPAAPGAKMPGERFGFAVAVHPRKPDTAWFAPAIKDEQRVAIDGAMSVTRTTDGGKTFVELRKGLPQEHAYDLVYRHGLNVDDTGDQLVMGSTTGSLWVSDDGGESWQTISRNLPPIFVTRFG